MYNEAVDSHVRVTDFTLFFTSPFLHSDRISVNLRTHSSRVPQGSFEAGWWGLSAFSCPPPPWLDLLGHQWRRPMAVTSEFTDSNFGKGFPEKRTSSVTNFHIKDPMGHLKNWKASSLLACLLAPARRHMPMGRRGGPVGPSAESRWTPAFPRHPRERWHCCNRLAI